VTLLAVAEEEGQPVSEYARRVDIYKAVCTRHLLDLGQRDRHGGPGLDLVTQKRDLQDLRINRTSINPKGAALLDRVFKLMRGEHVEPVKQPVRPAEPLNDPAIYAGG
jgi:DNA-binding MarR family transcriptional regulator